MPPKMEQQELKKPSPSPPFFLTNFSPSQQTLDLTYVHKNDSRQIVKFLNRKKIQDNDVNQLALFLTHNPNAITNIIFPIDDITDQGLASLCSALNHPNLRVTSLTLPTRTTLKLGLECAMVLRDFLKENTRLLSLDISFLHLKNEHVKAISEGIIHNSTLTSLKLLNDTWDGVDSVGVKYLCDALLVNTSLIQVDTWKVNIGNEGGKYIAHMLACNSSLRVLNLRSGGARDVIGEEGCEDICQILGEKNRSVLSFDFAGHRSNEKCIDLLGKNKYLVNISVAFVWWKSLYVIYRRNIGLWKERIRWSFVLNVLCRVLVLGGECERMPLEMIYHILGFVVPFGVMREDEVKRVTAYSTDIRCLGNDKMAFVRAVFGKGIKIVIEKLRK